MVRAALNAETQKSWIKAGVSTFMSDSPQSPQADTPSNITTPTTTPPEVSISPTTSAGRRKDKLGKIAFIGTGGTIASWSANEADFEDYNSNEEWVSGDQVVRYTGVDEFYDFHVVDWEPIDSTVMTAEHWHKLAAHCLALAQDHARLGIDGIVIGHGTATLEETAWALSLTLRVSIPVVVTGSMRPLNGISSDAAANLLAACHAAAYFNKHKRENPGVVVVANQEIHSPRTVTKTHTLSLDAFQSPGVGPFGCINGGEVKIHAQPWRPEAELYFDMNLLLQLKRVDVVYSYIGADATAINAYLSQGANGLVSAGFGPGLGNPAEIAAFSQAIGNPKNPKVFVVQSSRLGAGKVVDSLKHRGLGIIAGNDLNPQKARVLLALCVTAGGGLETVERAFSSL